MMDDTCNGALAAVIGLIDSFDHLLVCCTDVAKLNLCLEAHVKRNGNAYGPTTAVCTIRLRHNE
jgi:hypothetical protein